MESKIVLINYYLISFTLFIHIINIITPLSLFFIITYLFYILYLDRIEREIKYLNILTIVKQIETDKLEDNLVYYINKNINLIQELKSSNIQKTQYMNNWKNTLKILTETQEILAKKTNIIYELELELMNKQ